ncbi:MAG: exosome complex protein Rrp42 [Thermoplasmatales archaeon]|nr:exosome complex protein Rrp42 [Thermoplasmatales archaeon]
MSNEIISEIRRDHLLNLLAKGERADGRAFDEFRPITVETGFIESADGSARVRMGDTEVIAGLKMIPGTPYPDAPASGVMSTGAELIPLAHASFESGPPSPDAVELARVVDRGIRESKMIDMDDLCIEEGKEVWMCFIDIYAINHDGNLFDASNLAAVAALRTATVPMEQYGKGEDRPLKTTCVPISVTMAKIGNDLIVDPNFDEGHIASCRLTVATDENGDFRAMQKGGSGGITVAELGRCLDMAVEKGREIRDILG